MAKAKLINVKGETLKDITINDNVWAITPNTIVLKKAIDLLLASYRQGTKATKSVGMVAGSGKKPHRQKGTGAARIGQKRNPITRGGGHTFALTNRDYTFKMNKKERALALRSALSLKYQDKSLTIIDDIKLDTLKTKEFKNLLSTLKLEGKILFVTKEDNENLFMASRNLRYAFVTLANEINVYDIVNADILVCDEAAVNAIEEVLK